MSMSAKITHEMLTAIGEIPTAVLSDNLERLPGAVGLRPFHNGKVMVGRAVTVRTASGDNLEIHKALELLVEGDILVVDGGGEISRALVGEIMVEIAKAKGCAGFVIDGAVRDTAIIAAGSFPVFAKAAIHRGPYKNGPGTINQTVSIGGMSVSPGDIIVGDADGVVAFNPSLAADLIIAGRAQEKKEAEIIASIRNGTYSGAYAKPQK
jgi:RraA family protein